MYITNVSAEGATSETYIDNPTWGQVKSNILALNGWDLYLVTFEKTYEEGKRKGDTKEFMAIAGGGLNQLYICQIYSYEGEYRDYEYEGEHSELILFDPSKSYEEKIEIMNVFLEFYPTARCLKLDIILVAAETYARFGKIDKSLHWGYTHLNESSKLEIIEVNPKAQKIKYCKVLLIL